MNEPYVAIGSDETWLWTDEPVTPEAASGENVNWRPAAAVLQQEFLGKPIQQQIQATLDAGEVDDERLAVRAALVNCDLLMRSLGRPNREQIVTTRPAELTTLQAIDLANGQILSDMLAAGARQLLKQDWQHPDELIVWIYRYALARTPTSAELEVSRELIAGNDALTPERVEDLLWTVFMLPEFQLVR